MPDVELFVPTLPDEEVENEFINDLDTSIVDIVTFPAEEDDPLWIDFIIEEVAGNVLWDILRQLNSA